MRQAGILAAAGIISLKDMTERLVDDHENALLLGKELSEIPGITVAFDDIQISMVFFDMTKTGYDTNRLVEEFYEKGIKINPS